MIMCLPFHRSMFHLWGTEVSKRCINKESLESWLCIPFSLFLVEANCFFGVVVGVYLDLYIVLVYGDISSGRLIRKGRGIGSY